MSVLSLLNSIMESLGLPVETGIFSGGGRHAPCSTAKPPTPERLSCFPPDEYAVLTPLTDDFPLYGDDFPLAETQEVRISLFSKNNYTKRKNQITNALLAADFTITARRFVGYENETKYFNYAIDVAGMEE